MIVCIAEKPSVARDIAEVLGAHTRKEGYIEGNGYQVTWTFGHLCTLKEPHEYTPNWKSWSLGSLPMIPPRFGIKLIGHDPGIEKQFHIIEQLMQNADEIINCGDAGQEGELIQRWVMQKAGARCPVRRLWISSLTEEAIREGFSKLKDQSDFQSLYEAGLSRAIGDWLLGMNATRLYTIKYGQNKQVLSIGRVQTPTLALIVNRQLEIANFQPKQYWELKTNYRDTTFSALIRKSDEEIAAEMVTLYREYFTVTGIFENSVYDGVEEMLKTLKQAGIKIAMATSKPEKFAKIIADHFGLAQYFDVIGGACMDETRTEKQDVIRYVLEQCEEKELDKIVMVGDRSYDVVGGHAEGLKVIGVLYGYGDLKELSEAGADALATTPQEVAELVLATS